MTPDILAKSRAARGPPRIPRLSRAGVPGGRLGASRRDHPARHDDAPGRLAVARGARGVPAPRRRDCPLCHRSRGDRPWDPPLLRDDHAVPPERLRPDRREPRRATDQDRGKPLAPLDPRGLELARSRRPCSASTIPTARNRSRCKGAPKSWSDFVTAWGQLSEAHAADGGAGLAVLSESFSSPTLARLASEFRARYPQVHVGDLRRGQRREPARGPAVRHGARPRPHAPVRSSVGDPRPRRRPAPDRPGDDPSRARLRGRKACGSLGWRDEPALRR